MDMPKRIQGMLVFCKPKSVMGEYIALHGLMPNKELPYRLRNRIPRNQLWIRNNRCDDTDEMRKLMLLVHEATELALIKKYNFNYSDAHKIAEIADLWW